MAYASGQNEVAEQSNGLIAERARAMVINAGAPKQLWPEAVKAACHLLNRCPSKATNGKIPAQFWYESMYADSDAESTDVSPGPSRCYSSKLSHLTAGATVR